jgi:hypothetical protein
MRNLIGIILLVCVSGYQLLAQRTERRPFPLHKPALPTPTGKVSSHADYPQLCTQFTWEDIGNSWDTVSQSTFTYSINGWVTEEVRSNYASGNFVPDIRAVYSYSPSGWLVALDEFGWNGSAWDSTYRSEIAHDAFGNTTLYWSFDWNGSWDTTFGYQTRYTYRNVSQVESAVDQTWQNSQVGWLLQDSTYYSYDLANTWDTIAYHSYTGIGWLAEERLVGLTWHDFAKELPLTVRTQYYAAGWEDVKRARVTYGPYDSQTWIFDTYNAPDWDSTAKEVYIHDAEWHEVAYEFYGWAGGWNLSAGELNSYNYDGSGRTLERIREYYDGATYYFDRRFLYDNFFVGTAAATVPQVEVTAFPNPATDLVHFNVGLAQPGPVHIALHDLQGRLRVASQAHTGMGESTITVPLSDQLESGTYVYTVRTKAGETTGKVVVQR